MMEEVVSTTEEEPDPAISPTVAVSNTDTDLTDGNHVEETIETINHESPDLLDVDLDQVRPPSAEELHERVLQLENDRGQLTAEILEKDSLLGQLEREVGSLKAALEQREEEHSISQEEAQLKLKRLKEETDAKVAEFKKQYVQANHDKESMVMKYALGEKEVIVQRQAKEEVERRYRTALRDRDDVQHKLKLSNEDRLKLQQLADSRLQDVLVLRKDIDRWKEEIKVQEAKVTVANSRLKLEMEAHKETRTNLEETIKHLAETRQEIEITRKECSDFMNKIKSDDEEQKKRTKNTEIEQSAKLIIDATAAAELEALREKYKKIVEENNTLTQKIQTMECDRLENASQISKLKEIVASQKQEINELLAQVAEMESLRMQLQKSEEKCDTKEREVLELRAEAKELNEDMLACRRKEAELLEFTQKLTDKNVTLQSDLATLEAKASALESEHSRLASSVGEFKTNCSQTQVELQEEKKRRTEETELMAKKLAEKTKQVEVLTQQTLDAENEVKVLKRKNAASLKELTRELQNCKRKLDENERRSKSSQNMSSMSSRTSSNSSLSKMNNDTEVHNNGVSRNHLSVPSNLSSHENSIQSIPSSLVPDSQKMLDKIISLQRTLAKKQEKLDFMEEHTSNLLEEVKKKNKIFQNYVMAVETGALASAERDINKPAVTGKVHELEKKRKMSESGGIMASLYSSKLSDSHMTLELSLEINQKLQAVLEDTLLKNITLKENINTLGQEIAKISMQQGSSNNSR